MDWAKFLRGATIAIGLAGAIVIAPAAPAESASALPPNIHFRAIKVDVTPVAQDVGGPTAQWLAQALPGELQTAFANRLAPGDKSAPILVVRIRRVFLGASQNGLLGPASAVEALDNIDGAAVVVGPNGGEIGSYPLFVPLDNYTGGTNYEAGTEQRRINELAHAFAYWLPGQMGL
jgi:hypothetical protein